VGTFRGETSVFYVNRDGHLYRASVGSDARRIDADGGSPVDADAVAGPADFDGDGTTDLVYAHSEELKYIDQSGNTTVSTGEDADGNSVGAPRQYVAGGLIEVPVVNDDDIELISDSGTTDPSEDAAQTALTGIDWDGDGDLELVYVDDGSDELEIADVGTVVSDVDTSVGVA
jgi:hypothetical protein